MENEKCPNCNEELTLDDQTKMECSKCDSCFEEDTGDNEVEEIEEENIDTVEDEIEEEIESEISTDECNFDVFYKAYPKKKNKSDAKKIWNIKIKNNEIDDIVSYLKTANKLKLPQPAKFLNDARWRNDNSVVDTRGRIKKSQVKKEKVNKKSKKVFKSKKSIKNEEVVEKKNVIPIDIERRGAEFYVSLIGKIKSTLRKDEYVNYEKKTFIVFKKDSQRRLTLTTTSKCIRCEFFNVKKVTKNNPAKLVKDTYKGDHEYHKFSFTVFDEFIEAIGSIMFN